MSKIDSPSLQPKLLFKNKHFNTLYRYFKTDLDIPFQRKRIPTKDGDFLDLDISSVESDTAIIAVHGLEGSSNSSYIKTLASYFNTLKIDVVAMNLRSCSGELNLKLESYHSGKTEDLEEVITYVLKKKNYKTIYLVGYSLGGNIVLKYMGEYADKIPKEVKKAIGISVPCDLKGSAMTISKLGNTFYKYNFLKTLKEKALLKLKQHTNHQLDVQKIKKATTFKEFDDAFTAPTNGFLDAVDYWNKSSCNNFLHLINKPSLLITALDDPFLSPSCYPFEITKINKNFHIIAPKFGGHVGFCEQFNMDSNLWLENQIKNFLLAQ